MGEQTFLPLSELRDPPHVARPVRKQSEEYLSLVDSIREPGHVWARSVGDRTFGPARPIRGPPAEE